MQGMGCSELGQHTIFNEHPVVNSYSKRHGDAQTLVKV